MTAPGLDHYREAERLLGVSASCAGKGDVVGAKRALEKAHTHALLAQTAAIAIMAAGVPVDGATAYEWRKVFCVAQSPNRGQKSQQRGSSVASRTDR